MCSLAASSWTRASMPDSWRSLSGEAMFWATVIDG